MYEVIGIFDNIVMRTLDIVLFHINQITTDICCQAMLSPVSTWMGDHLGTLGAVGISLILYQLTIYVLCSEERPT